MDVHRNVSYHRLTLRWTDSSAAAVQAYFGQRFKVAYRDKLATNSRTKTMAGITIFSSVSEALRAGFHIYDRTNSGYLVRTRTARGWALAVVNVVNPRT
jgi:hypothetical protein